MSSASEESICEAVVRGDYDKCRLLLQKGLNPDVETLEGDPILHHVVSSGDVTMVNILLASGCLVNRYSSDGETPLHVAVGERNQSMTKALLEKGANVRLNTAQGESALFIAANENHSGIVRLLLDYGAPTDNPGNKDHNPLHVAVKTKNTDIIKMLLDKGAHVNGSGAHLLPPLHTAVEGNDLTIVALLLDYGAFVNLQSQDGNTALHLAVKPGHVTLINLLLAHKANVNLADGKGITPVHVAVREKYEHILTLLLKHNPVFQPNSDLLCQAVSERSYEMVAMLLEAGINANGGNKDGENPLHLATRQANQKLVGDLLRSGSNPNSLSFEKGESSLHIAVRRGMTSIVQALLSHGACANTPTLEGWTPLLEAAKHGSPEVVRHLLNAGAKVNHLRPEPDEELCKAVLGAAGGMASQLTVGISPLLQAASHGHGDAMEMLLNYGAETNAIDQQGYVVLHWTVFYNMGKITHELLCRGAVINIRSFQGHTPLELVLQVGMYPSCHHGDQAPWMDMIRMLVLLLQHGADLYPDSLSLTHPDLTDHALEDIHTFLFSNGLVPVSMVTNNAAAQQRLQRTHMNPLTLRIQARRSIRNTLKALAQNRSIWKGIQTLPLPNSLVDFLHLQDEWSLSHA